MPAPSPPHPTLSADALAAIYAHAQRDYPRECCGIVYGPRDRPIADRSIACDNIQDRLHSQDPARFMHNARTAYNMGKRDILELQNSLCSDTPAKIVYHSHVDVGSYFSQDDQAAAKFNDGPAYPIEHVVVDIRTGGPHGARQFAWNPSQRQYAEVGAYA